MDQILSSDPKKLQAIEGGELLLLNVDASSPPIHRGREPPETARKQSGDFWVMATADFEALACLHSGELTKSYGKSTMLLMGKSTISMAIFNCYVSSPEGS